jgi:hypothetical protein
VYPVGGDETVMRAYIRKKELKTNDWINATCGSDLPPSRRLNAIAASSATPLKPI